MDWREQAAILITEIVTGYVLGRVFIPYFRKIKTGKFDFYIGDRFAKDGSEPKFAGFCMLLTAVIGVSVGLIFQSAEDSMSLSQGSGIQSMIYVAAAFVVTVLTAVGMYQDYVKETKRGIGLKRRQIVLTEFAVCLAFVIVIKYTGLADTKILLPFHWGNFDLGFGYYPVTAIFMTVIINLVEIHNCPEGVTQYSCDGLCAVTMLMFSLAVASGSSLSSGLKTMQIFAVCTAGVCAGYLFWGISPSKIYLGESGGLFLGGAAAVITASGSMPIIFLLGGIVFIADGVCTFLQHVVYRHSKKLLFMGITLHGHFQNKGWGEYKIMGWSAIITAVGAVGVFAFISYADKIML